MRTGLRIVYVMAMVVCGGLMALTANADLVAYWNFDEGGGTTAADYSSNGNDGTLQGTPVWVAGHTGGAGDFAIDFAGGSRVDVPDSDSLDLTTNFTIAAWHYWNGVSALSRVLIKGPDGGSYTWWGNSGLTPNHVFTHDITQFHDTTTDFTSGAWHHQAWTYDGTTLRSYYDGTLSESWTTSFTMTPNTDALLIGNRATGGRQWQGYLDDVVIFDSVEDITQIMNGTHPAMGGGGDTTPPSIESKTPHSVTGVYPGANLVATFSEAIAIKSGGTITLTDTDDATGTVVINLPDVTQVTVSDRDLIINPSANLEFGANFEIVIDNNAIEDFASTPNVYPGTSVGEWTFMTVVQDLTPPLITLKSPGDDATGVSPVADIVATFDDKILMGAGDIVIKDLDDGTTTQTIPVTDARVTIVDKELTINPAGALALGKHYAVRIEAGAVKNFSDVGCDGITNDIDWNFAVKEPGLVAYWNFDEGGGTTAADSSSNGNDGTLQGTPVWVAGHTGGAGDFAIDFAGGSRVDVPDSDSLDLTTTFTIAAWHYWNGVSAFSRVLIKGPDGGSYTWWGNSGLTPNHVFTHDITQFHDTTTDFTSGAWHHQAWTYDGTTLRSYYDGTLSESWTTSFTMTPNTDALLIGNRATGGRQWQGYLDDVVIFDSVEDITQIMNGTHPDMQPPPPAGTVLIIR